ncbi:hypothetical protein [uncultured Sulfitobacter sp.]|uniref:hypothetical protein n=1 Tax=uncultured Sulfitobacter sp. TaxID=191468 RepID=UPI002625312F|nr:hypothetical protein [uncultured Sulfitobacter sp.]
MRQYGIWKANGLPFTVQGFAQDGRAISLTELAAANDFPAEELQGCPPSEVSGQWNGMLLLNLDEKCFSIVALWWAENGALHQKARHCFADERMMPQQTCAEV